MGAVATQNKNRLGGSHADSWPMLAILDHRLAGLGWWRSGGMQACEADGAIQSIFRSPPSQAIRNGLSSGIVACTTMPFSLAGGVVARLAWGFALVMSDLDMLDAVMYRIEHVYCFFREPCCATSFEKRTCTVEFRLQMVMYGVLRRMSAVGTAKSRALRQQQH
jgi:hypothetical protein